MKTLKQIFTEPLLVLNFLVRCVFFFFAAIDQRWWYGDAGHYIYWAEDFCRGRLMGDLWRMPLYEWFIGVSSFCQAYRLPEDTNAGRGAELTSAMQSLVIFFIGALIVLYLKKRGQKRSAQVLAGFFLFDPVFLIYSNFIMTDAIVGAFSLIAGFLVYQIIKKTLVNRDDPKIFRLSIGLAFVFLCLVYTRALETVPVFFCGLLFTWLLFKQKLKVKNYLAVFLITAALLVPRVLLIHRESGAYALSTQGSIWMETVVAAVKYEKEGLPFHDAELRWFKENPHATSAEIYETLFDNFGSWAWMTGKGMARVLFGHVNVEYSRLFTGVTPIGPGFFKNSEGGSGSPMKKNEIVKIIFWVLGIGFILIYTVFFYVSMLKSYIREGRKKDEVRFFGFWVFSTSLVLAFIPQVLGDARFRLPFWPLLVLLWVVSVSHEYKRNPGGK